MTKKLVSVDDANYQLPAPVVAVLDGRYPTQWQPATAYAAGQRVISPSGDVVSAIAAFTSGATFNPANWSYSTTFARSASPAREDVRNYGAIGDFVSHPLSSKFATLAAAQAVYPEATSLSDEIDWCAIMRCIAVNNAAYLSPDAFGNKTFVIGNGKSIDISTKGGVLIYGHGSSLVVQTSANTPVFIIANAGNVFRDFAAGYVSQRAATETNSIVFYMKGGGTNAFYNSTFQRVGAQYGAKGWYNDGPTAVFSCSWRDCEVRNFSIVGFDVWTNYGMTSNRVDNLYIHNNTAGSGHTATRGVATQGGFRAMGWQSGSIDNVNVEHLTAPYGMCIDSCPGTDIRSLYMENVEINQDASGPLVFLTTNTGVPVVGMDATVTGFSFAYGQLLAADGLTNVGLIVLAPTVKLQVQSIQVHDSTITAPNAYVFYCASPTAASVYAATVVTDAGYTAYNSALAASIKRYGDTWNTQTVPAAALPTVLAAGEATINPDIASASVGSGASQRLQLTYFTATRTETCTQVVFNGSGAAGATPTLVQVGIYSVDASDNLTLVASTPNDTTLFASASTRYAKAFSSSFVKTAGQRYAVGLLVVTSATMPTVYGANPFGGSGNSLNTLPRRAGRVSGQASLPSTITAGSVTTDGSRLYAEVTP